VKDPKQKKQMILLSVLLLALAVVLYYAFAGGTDSSIGGPSSKKVSQMSTLDIKDLAIARNPRRSGGKKEMPLKDVDPTIHLERLSHFDPGTPLNSRNMFSLEAQAVPSVVTASPPGRPVIPKPAPESNVGIDAGRGGGRSPLGAPVNINLKFIGFALNPVQKTRQGFFTDGDQVYIALEGQLVANRYRVVHISDALAEIEEVSSKTRRQISLVTQ
jgi:hypothetical protein